MSQTPRRRRHLIDMDNPPVVAQRDPMSIGQVQKWVMSVLAVSTILHMSGALVIFAIAIDEAHQTSRVGLLLIAGAFGILAVMVGRFIQQAAVVTPWVVLGLIPMGIGFWWIFAR